MVALLSGVFGKRSFSAALPMRLPNISKNSSSRKAARNHRRNTSVGEMAVKNCAELLKHKFKLAWRGFTHVPIRKHKKVIGMADVEPINIPWFATRKRA
jgi:hypothetical protein